MWGGGWAGRCIIGLSAPGTFEDCHASADEGKGQENTVRICAITS